MAEKVTCYNAASYASKPCLRFEGSESITLPMQRERNADILFAQISDRGTTGRHVIVECLGRWSLSDMFVNANGMSLVFVASVADPETQLGTGEARVH